MEAIIYARFSPRPNADECQSIETQKERCTAYCTAQGYSVCAVHTDAGLSGASTERPGLQHALAAVCESKGILVVYSLDRLARNTKDAIEISERLNKAGAELASVAQSINTHTSHGRFFFTLLAAIATLEREQIAERTSVAMQAHQRRGRRMSRRPPYGWAIAGKSLVKDDDEQANIKMILDWWNDGCSEAGILNMLRERVLTMRGERFRGRDIRKIIRRETA